MTASIHFIIEVGLAVLKRVRVSRHHAAQLRELVRPPPGVILVSHDGDSYTGIVVVADNLPALMLAVRRPPPPQSSRWSSARGPSPDDPMRSWFES